VPASAARTEQQRSISVAVKEAGHQSASVVSLNSAAGLFVGSHSLTSAAGVRRYSGVSNSVQSDNSFDAEYCDVEPDSSPGSVTNEDVADVSTSATCVSAAVTGVRDDCFSSSSCHSVHARSSGAERTTTLQSSTAIIEPAVVTSDGVLPASLPIFISMTRGNMLPKSTLASPPKSTCEGFPSPVIHKTDIFHPVLPPASTDRLMDYVAPVMAAESSVRCFRFLPSTAAALCDTSTVSSPSFARSRCAAISTAAKHPHLEPTVSESSAVDRQVCNISLPSLVSDLAQRNTVVTSSTPVMADVLQAQLDQGSLHQLSAAGLPVVRSARLTDHTELLNALLSQSQLGISKTEALAGVTGRQQVLPNDLTVPVIAFLNLGDGTGSLPSFSCAAVLPPGALQFVKLSVSNESVLSSVAGGSVSSVEQVRPL